MDEAYKEKLKEKLERIFIEQGRFELLKLLNMATPLLIQIYAWIRKDGLDEAKVKFLNSLYDAWIALDNTNILEKVLTRPSFSLLAREKAERINSLLKELGKELARHFSFWLHLESRGIMELMEGKVGMEELKSRFEEIKENVESILNKVIEELKG